MSKKIPLTQGQFTIVDDDMYEYLNQWKWYALWSKHTKGFYTVRKSKTENGKQHIISMAREILGLGRGDEQQADHLDHNTLDNRKLNLRLVTHNQNQWNQKKPRGYYWDKQARKYRAQIHLNGKQIYLGLFQSAEEAHSTYLEAKTIYHKF